MGKSENDMESPDTSPAMTDDSDIAPVGDGLDIEVADDGAGAGFSGNPPELEALFAEAVAGQERLRAQQHPEESEGADSGIRGADPREVYNRMRQTMQDQVETLARQKAQIAELEAKVAEQKDRLLRSQADYENFRKRMTKEREERMRHANEEFVRALLPVLDNFGLALASIRPDTGVESVMTGVKMILGQLEDMLARQGVTPVDAIGQPFDPNYHEAVQQVEPGEVPPGHVAAQLQRGYVMHGRLVRPARVAVASGAPAAPAGETGGH